MPTEIETLQAGALTDIAAQGTVHKGATSATAHVPAFFGEKGTPLEKGHHFGAAQTDDIVIPTLEELEGASRLRRISAPIPWAVYTIAFVELCERFSYYGVQVVFSNFVNHALPNGSLPGSNPKTGAGGSDPNAVSGALGMGTEVAAGLGTFLTFWAYFTPLFGAYLADTRWGRFKTICFGIGLAILAHIVLIISSIPPIIVNRNAALGVYCLSLVLLGAGTGAFKPNISPLVVEQIPIKIACVETLSSGERVIVDPIITQSRIYHYFYLFINIGALIGQVGMAYAEKYVGFWLAYTLPTILFLTCPLVMFWGRKRYDQSPPQGSVYGKALKLFFYAQKGRWSLNPWSTFKKLNDGTMWDSAKPSRIEASRRPSWMTFDDAWVDEVRRGMKACSVFAWYPLYWIAYNPLNTTLTAQASTMTLHGVPNDVLNNLDPFALIIFIPICDALLYPALRKYNIRFTPIRKITFGFFLATLAMLWAGVIQVYIYRMSPCGNQANTCVDDLGNVLAAPINVWAQTGVYVLIALSEIFASITSLEYAYSKAPRSMRSLVQAVALFMNAISAAISEAVVPLTADPLLQWNYFFAAILAAVGGLCFHLQYRSLDREEDVLNLLPEGHVIADVKGPQEEEYEDPRPIAGEITEKN